MSVLLVGALALTSKVLPLVSSSTSKYYEHLALRQMNALFCFKQLHLMGCIQHFYRF